MLRFKLALLSILVLFQSGTSCGSLSDLSFRRSRAQACPAAGPLPCSVLAFQPLWPTQFFRGRRPDVPSEVSFIDFSLCTCTSMIPNLSLMRQLRSSIASKDWSSTSIVRSLPSTLLLKTLYNRVETHVFINEEP